LTGNGTAFELSARWKANAATAVYDPPQSGWGIGTFAFSADNSATGTNQVSAGSIRMEASENWTATATGTELSFVANRAGVLNQGRKVLNMTPERVDIQANTIAFSDDATTTQLADFDVSRAEFRVPVTTQITTTTISEGTTYTPAATVDNNISVQINTLAGGTTVIDLASLTGNSRGASYNILVFNNTASGTPIQVKNTRINTNNLMTHTITTGDRIIINAYIVGDYATAQHLLVA
jgi:hypothetical protein